MTTRPAHEIACASQLVLSAVVSVALATVHSREAAASMAGSYEGLAAWVDVFDPEPWNHPERWMGQFARRDVTTVFVQTSNHRRQRAIHRPRALARLLRAADRRGIEVIAWYLPGFDDPSRDWRRVKAAVTYESASGARFDGFAMDIESTAVRSIAVRNRRMLRLSSRLRNLVGDGYALGVIAPDPVTQRYWPRFPWRAIAERFDAVLPMCYWTFQISGEARVYRHVRNAIRSIRAKTGDRPVPVHVIGGIASHASVAEVRGLARAAVDFGAAGASLYDAPITRPRQWTRMAPVARLGAGRNPRRGAGRRRSARARAAWPTTTRTTTGSPPATLPRRFRLRLRPRRLQAAATITRRVVMTTMTTMTMAMATASTRWSSARGT